MAASDYRPTHPGQNSPKTCSYNRALGPLNIYSSFTDKLCVSYKNWKTHTHIKIIWKKIKIPYSGRSGFESYLCHLPVTWSWLSRFLKCLSLSFPIYKMGINNTHLTGGREDGVKSKREVSLCLQGVTVTILVQPLKSFFTLSAFS